MMFSLPRIGPVHRVVVLEHKTVNLEVQLFLAFFGDVLIELVYLFNRWLWDCLEVRWFEPPFSENISPLFCCECRVQSQHVKWSEVQSSFFQQNWLFLSECPYGKVPRTGVSPILLKLAVYPLELCQAHEHLAPDIHLLTVWNRLWDCLDVHDTDCHIVPCQPVPSRRGLFESPPFIDE